MTEKNQRF